MRSLLIAVLLIALLVVVGWVSFYFDGRRAGVSLDTREVREDTHELVTEGKEAVQKVTGHGRDWIDKSDEDAPRP